MAAGLIPKYQEEFPFGDLTTEQFLVIASEAVKSLEWKISYVSPSGLIAFTDNGMFTWNAEVRVVIENETATVKSASVSNEIVDFGRNKRTVKEFISSFSTIKKSLSEEEFNAKYQSIEEDMALDENDILKLPPPSASEKFKHFLSVFKPSKGYFITPILVNLNILIFILMAVKGIDILMPSNEGLLNWGANFRPLTLEGQWWRLMTNTFLHIGIMHLLLNMYALIYIGLLLEPYLGKRRFVSAYLLTGLTASIASLWWHDNTISAGASGAIFGMYGVFLALLTTNFIEKTTRKALLTSIGIFVAYNLLYGLKSGIDNAAHIGGLIGGLIMGYCFIPSLKRPHDNPLNYSIIGSLAVLTILACAAVYKNTPNVIGNYEKEMKQFSTMESMALEIYHLPKNTPKSKLLYEIKDRGIYYWNEDLRIINEIETLKLPEGVDVHTAQLKQYCNLRIKCYELIYKAVDEDTNKYRDQIDNYNRQIQAIIDNMKDK